MILSYFAKLLCLSFSAFFLVHASSCLALYLMTPAALRFAERISPRAAARFLFVLRLLPLGLSLLVVLGMCVPSYLWFEPQAVREQVGVLCMVAAVLGAAILTLALVRGIRALAGSMRYMQQFRAASSDAWVSDGQKLSGGLDRGSPFLMIEEKSPLVMLAGVMRAQVVVSSGVVQALPADQLDVAVRHEQAHAISHDNCKRLLVLLAPDVAPFWRGFSALERTWARFSEWAADDRATDGDPRRSLALASALLCLARMGAAQRLPSLIASLVPAGTDSAGKDLAARVERLLLPQSVPQPSPQRLRGLLGGGTLVFASIVGVWVLGIGSSQASVHALLESLIR